MLVVSLRKLVTFPSPTKKSNIMKLKSNQLAALEAVVNAGATGAGKNSMHFRVRDMLVKLGLIKIVEKKKVEVLVATPEGRKALKATLKAVA